MIFGIEFLNCVDTVIIGPVVTGVDGGINLVNSKDTVVIGGYLESGVGIAGDRVNGLKAHGIRHDDRQWRLRPSLLAERVRRAIHGDV